MFSVIQKFCRFFYNIGEHEEYHLDSVLAALALQMGRQILPDSLQLLRVHGIDLAHAEGNILHNKLLEILVKDLLRRLIPEIAAGLEHFRGKLFNMDFRDPGQGFRRRLVHGSAGG